MFSRAWAMPTAETFSCPPIGEFVLRYRHGVSVDPFARNSVGATHTNDIDLATDAQHHMDAEAFMEMLAVSGVVADTIIIDPPYSPRQIAECYSGMGRQASKQDTQSAALYARVRRAARKLCKPGTVVLSFGWNSAGMGKDFGEIMEILLVAHGGAHNDTICMAESAA